MDIDLTEPVEFRATGRVRANAARRSSVTIDQLLAAIRDAVDAALEPVVEQIADLESRIVTLETKPSPWSYEGVWQPDRFYSVGMFVTHSGAMWACTRLTTYKPGDGDSGWRLAVKAGKIGRGLFDAARALGLVSPSCSEREWFNGLMAELRDAAIAAGRGDVSEQQAIPGSLRHRAR